MKPEDKAKELYKKYFNSMAQKEYIEKINEINFCNWNKELHIQEAKKCALICVDEMIEEIRIIEFGRTSNLYDSIEFWNEVKQEINKI